MQLAYASHSSLLCGNKSQSILFVPVKQMNIGL